MDVCRVCLSNESVMIPLHETFIESYNILTNLNVKMYDNLPQYTCGTCVQTVKNFIEFREKSISSETTLRKLLSLKSEDKLSHGENKSIELTNQMLMMPELEVKHEICAEELLDDGFNDMLFDINKDINLEINSIKDIKPQRRSKKTKKKKLKINNNPTVIWKVQKDIRQEEAKKFYCGLCNEVFEHVIELNEHLEKHIKDRSCGICNEIMYTWAELLGHRLNHLPTKQIHCHLCCKRFMTSVNLEFHYKAAHFGEDPKLLCIYCNSSYTSPKKLRKHMWAIHSDKNYICDYCSKSFSTRANLTSHIISHMKQKKFVCVLCGLSFNYSHGLKNHTIRKHTPSKVYCTICKRPFPSKDEHDKHKCANIKKILCQTCGKYYTTSQIKRHLLTHTNVRKYKCNRCIASYKSRSGLKAHLDQHDGNKTQKCEFCPAKFYNPSALIKHRRIHTGEKPYVCKICSKGFTGNHNLKVHMKVHGEHLVNKKKTPETDVQHTYF